MALLGGIGGAARGAAAGQQQAFENERTMAAERRAAETDKARRALEALQMAATQRQLGLRPEDEVTRETVGLSAVDAALPAIGGMAMNTGRRAALANAPRMSLPGADGAMQRFVQDESMSAEGRAAQRERELQAARVREALAAEERARTFTREQQDRTFSQQRELQDRQDRRSWTTTSVVGPDGVPVIKQVNNATGEVRNVGQAPARAGGAGGALPASIRSAVAQNQVQLNKLEEAIRMVEQNKDAFGLQNYIPGAVTQRLPGRGMRGGVDVRSLVADVGSLEIRDRSGAAVTAAEFPRLRPFIPLTTDDPDKVLQNLRQMYKAVREETDLLTQGVTTPNAAAPTFQQWTQQGAPGAPLPGAAPGRTLPFPEY